MYIERYPLDFSKIKNKDLTVSYVFEQCTQRINAFIDELLGLEPIIDEEMVFIPLKMFYRGEIDIDARLVPVAEELS